MSVDLTRDEPEHWPPLIDPDLSLGTQYGYRDPYRATGIRVYYGPPPHTPAPRRPRGKAWSRR